MNQLDIFYFFIQYIIIDCIGGFLTFLLYCCLLLDDLNGTLE